MFRTLRLRTLRQILIRPSGIERSDIYRGSRGIASMAGLLKKPVKIALVQLASGLSPSLAPILSIVQFQLSFQAHSYSRFRKLTPSQAPINLKTSYMPDKKSSKQLLPAPKSLSCQNVSTRPTAPPSSPPTPKYSSLLHPPKNNRPHTTPSPPWQKKPTST